MTKLEKLKHLQAAVVSFDEDDANEYNVEFLDMLEDLKFELDLQLREIE